MLLFWKLGVKCDIFPLGLRKHSFIMIPEKTFSVFFSSLLKLFHFFFGLKRLGREMREYCDSLLDFF